jgi:membrane associated rhomboid family serine protease
MFVWPWLNGIPSLKKAPVTWLLIFINIIVFLAMVPAEKEFEKKIVEKVEGGMTDSVRASYREYLAKNDPNHILEKEQYLSKEEINSLLLTSALEDEGFQAAYPAVGKEIKEFKEMAKHSPESKWAYSKSHLISTNVITSMFVHGGWAHLIFNMLFFIFFAGVVEQMIGGKLMLMIYLLVDIIVTAIYVYTMDVSVIGASGAISTIFGVWFALENQKLVRYFYFILPVPKLTGLFTAPPWLALIFWVATDAIYAFTTVDNVAYGVHILDFVVGYLIGLYIKRYPVPFGNV